MRLTSINIQGYRPFGNFQAQLQPLEIIVGANGAGKSSLFEFLKFLRDSLYYDIPPEIISGSIGQQIFHIPGLAKFEWDIEIDTGRPIGIRYLGELMGPVGRTQVSYERVESSKPFNDKYKNPYIYMDIRGNKGLVQNPDTKKFTQQEIALKRSNQLALSTMTNPSFLSDGILRLICWICLCVYPNPPSLICIDEPDQGVHPRTLPVLAALFEKASERTQILLATHSSYFLTQFDISQIAVLRKENGEAKFIKPGESQVLIDMLDDFGADEIEQLHRSDELERLP
ncbi:MAG: AAA family ATPase [Dolichospermum sp.]